ncbi:MAG: hypothetical protein V8Q54_00845 [Alistipes senegalensis]
MKLLDGFLLLDRGQQHGNPQDVVVTQLVEEFGIGVPDDLLFVLV